MLEKKMVELKFLGFIAECMGVREMRISLNQPETLGQLLKTREFPKERAIVVINQKGGSFDSVIKDGDKVIIMPVISGG